MSGIREVVPGITVSTSKIMLTNSIILSSQGEAFLIDPAWMPDELEAIGDFLLEQDLKILGGFATHAHHDHLLWHPSFGGAPRWASAQTAKLATDHRVGLIAALGPDFPASLTDLMGRVHQVPGTIPEECNPAGIDIEQIVHDGHFPGHTALWLPQQRVLIAGDMLSDVELPLPLHPGGLADYQRGLADYQQGLEVLAPFARKAEIIIPGHGHIGTDPGQRLDADRAYLDEVLRHGGSDDPRIGNPGMAEAHKRLQEQTLNPRE